MIKAEATVNGIISRSAMMKTGKDGKSFTAMTVKVDVTDRNGSGISLDVMSSSCSRSKGQTNNFRDIKENDGNENTTYEKNDSRPRRHARHEFFEHSGAGRSTR